VLGDEGGEVAFWPTTSGQTPCSQRATLPVTCVGVAKVLLNSWKAVRDPSTVTLSGGSAVWAEARIPPAVSRTEAANSWTVLDFMAGTSASHYKSVA